MLHSIAIAGSEKSGVVVWRAAEQAVDLIPSKPSRGAPAGYEVSHVRVGSGKMASQRQQRQPDVIWTSGGGREEDSTDNNRRHRSTIDARNSKAWCERQR